MDTKSLFGQVVKAATAFGLTVGKFTKTESEYERTFVNSKGAAKDVEQPEEYLRPVEFEDDDETRVFVEICKHFLNDVEASAGLNPEDGVYQDPHWGHTTGFFAGELSIDPHNLKKGYQDFRVGLFKEKRKFDVVVRPNFLFDDEPTIAISRMSIKIKHPELVDNQFSDSKKAHELDLLLSEGLPLKHHEADGQGFFFRDAKQMLMLLELGAATKWGKLGMAGHAGHSRVLAHWGKGVFQANTDALYKPKQMQLGWAGKYFYSAGPYALGDGAMKFCLKPLQEHKIEPTLDFDDAAQGAIRREHNWPEQAGDEIKFLLMVQIAKAEAIDRPEGEGHPPKSVMAAEYTDISWDDKIAEFEEVGVLTIKRETPDDWKDIDYFANLPISAWNTFDATRPLGQLFRARRVVHPAHRKERLTKVFGDEKGVHSWTCPFSGGGKF